MHKLHPGAVIGARELMTIRSKRIRLPICDLHLRSIVRRHQELVAAGIREVVVFRFSSAAEGRTTAARPVSPRRILAEHRRALVTAGVASGSIQALRAARVAIVPLWADHIGLPPEAASLLFGLSLGVEVLFVYPGGSIMDHFGRKAVAVPCLVIMSAGMALLPLAQSAWSMALVAVWNRFAPIFGGKQFRRPMHWPGDSCGTDHSFGQCP